MHIIEAINITKKYEKHTALNNVCIQIPGNSIYGLLGPNGAGKTTFIRIINRIMAPDSGTILFDNRPIQPADTSLIGYLPEERGLYKKMRVGEHIVYLAQLKGMPRNEAKIRMKQWLARFDISHWEKRQIEELSKGMQQKVQFITTVIHTPRLLIFDEPFSGFDPINAELLKQEIINLKKEGATVILSTHNMNSVEELCDEISLINRSQVVLQGKVSEIRNRYKKGLFKIKVSSGELSAEENLYTIISEKSNSEGREIILKKADNISINELITRLAAKYPINAFEEMLPSMNEIFIDTVEDRNNTKNERNE